MSVEARFERFKEKAYAARVDRALTALLRRTREAGESRRMQLELEEDRWILLSDLHRGGRDGADDFRLAEPAFNAALAYYLKKGYTLIVLGDAEELWEERPAAILRSYRRSLELEAQFHQQGRYARIWGNHDDLWAFPDRVRSLLVPVFRSPITVHESLLVDVSDGGRHLGQILLAHGHHGSRSNDAWSFLTRLLVRFFWRPFQRLTGYSPNLPSGDWELRETHDVALYAWAAQQAKLILIAGHTHRPTFASQSRSAELEDRLTQLEEEQALRPQVYDLEERVAETAAELEWIKAQEMRKPGGQPVVPMYKPCYFNTGCCCFQDGDITGLEISRGEIRLVRWPDNDGRVRPEVLSRAPLRALLERC